MSDRSAPETLFEMFVRRVEQDADRTALWIKSQGVYGAVSWQELAGAVDCAAVVLQQLGVRPGDRVIQLSENRYEWIVLDLAIQLAQVVHVPVHAPLAGPQVAQQVHDSGARIVFASSDAQARKLERAAAQLPPDLVYVSYEPTDAKIGTAGFSQMSCLLEDVDAAAADGMKQQCLQHLSAEALATILYTSGTTGEPKGVVLNQRNLVSNTLATITAFGVLEADVRLGFLPLSHIFARTCDLYTTIAVGSQLALAESRDTVLSDCQEIKPTIINGVPYFYQLLQRRLAAESDDESGGLRELLGGNMRMCCSGGAALPDHLFDYFQRQNLPLLQGYGLTESSPVITLSSLRQVRRGAVGKPIPGVEVRIAADGEILTRGPHVMVGYWQRPEATAEVIRDGWLHTGDLGHLDEDGFLYITGRKKELIVTSAGKNIAPVHLESLLTEDPLIAQALVIGDNRSYLTALIVPNPTNLEAEIRARKIRVFSKKAALVHAEVLKLYEAAIAHRLADVSHHEQVRNFTLLDRGFSVELGEMTPKFSLCRAVIEQRFVEQIEAMYRE